MLRLALCFLGLLPVSAFSAASPSSSEAVPARVEVSSLAELEQAAARDHQLVVLRPGVYRSADLLTEEAVAARRERRDFAVINFSGSDNTFVFDGVEILHDTATRHALRAPIHTTEFIVTGHRNTLRGLTLTCVGEGTSPAGALFQLAGDHNTVEDTDLTVTGSFPYAYGDLFGKGGRPVIGHRKHSGFLVTGQAARVLRVKLHMRSFGHGFFIQGGDDHHFEDCEVDGVMRPTDDMLAEISGPAFEKNFAMELRNREGEHRVLPGYVKSLSEDGFRTYGQNKNLTFVRCVARHMRGGFELRTQEKVRLIDCAAYGNERGFWIRGATLENCRGDAEHGPLLFVEGRGSRVDLAVLPASSRYVIHALALIHGEDHRIRLAAPEGERAPPLPIRIGYGTPAAGEGMAAIPERPARDIALRNDTSMPIEIGPQAVGARIETRGAVARNDGRDIRIGRLTAARE